jgi:hypothetical protein
VPIFSLKYYGQDNPIIRDPPSDDVGYSVWIVWHKRTSLIVFMFFERRHFVNLLDVAKLAIDGDWHPTVGCPESAGFLGQFVASLAKGVQGLI